MTDFVLNPIESFISFPVPGSQQRIDTPNYEWLDMWEYWRLPYSLWGGTKRMRKAGKYYLPQEPGETDQSYEARVQKTFLYNAYRRSIQSLAGQPFIKPVTVHNLPTELEYLLDDADSMGNSLTEVAHNLLIDGLHYGKYHVLVDYPSVDGNITLRDQRELNIAPYFNTVSPLNLIGWESERVGGMNALLNIRIKEYSIEPVDEYQELLITRVRVYKPDEVEVHAIYGRESGDFDVEGVSDNTLGRVPLITGYVEKTGFMSSRPPLEDLAWLNLRHWQSSSEQNVILHATRVPIFFASGFEEGELENTTIGPYRGISTTNDSANIRYIEHEGNAITAGERDLEKIEKQMEKMGSDILQQKGVSRQTATARQIDKSESLSVMQLAVRELEHSLEKAIQIAGDWINVDASDVKVTIGDDLSVPTEANSVDDLMNLHDRGKIDDEQLVFELKRRGTLSSSAEDVPPNLDTEMVETDEGEEEDEEQNQE